MAKESARSKQDTSGASNAFANKPIQVGPDGVVNLPAHIVRLVPWIPEKSNVAVIVCLRPTSGIQIDSDDGQLGEWRAEIADLLRSRPPQAQETNAQWMRAVRFYQASWQGTISYGGNKHTLSIPAAVRDAGIIRPSEWVAVLGTGAILEIVPVEDKQYQAGWISEIREIARDRNAVILGALEKLRERDE